MQVAAQKTQESIKLVTNGDFTTHSYADDIVYEWEVTATNS